MNKSLYWSIKLTLGLFGIIAIYQIVPYFMKMLSALVLSIEYMDKTSTNSFLLICLGLWVTCSVLNVIVNIIFKLQAMLKKDYVKSLEDKRRTEKNKIGGDLR